MTIVSVNWNIGALGLKLNFVMWKISKVIRW